MFKYGNFHIDCIDESGPCVVKCNDEKVCEGPCTGVDLHKGRIVKLHHKFMLASYMKQIAKFLALLHHNASFYNFCFIIKFSHCLIFSQIALMNACQCLGLTDLP